MTPPDRGNLPLKSQVIAWAALATQETDESKCDWSNVPEVRGVDMAEQQFKLEVPAQIKKLPRKQSIKLREF